MPLPNPAKIFSAVAALGDIPTPPELMRAGEKQEGEQEILRLIAVHKSSTGKGARASTSRDVGIAIAKFEAAGHTFDREKHGIGPNEFPTPGATTRGPRAVDPGAGFGPQSGTAPGRKDPVSGRMKAIVA